MNSAHSSIDLGLNSWPAPIRRSAEAAVEQAIGQQVVKRIWEHDHTLWKPHPREITDRLGWLEIVAKMQERTGLLTAMASEMRCYRHALLMGMGGSSLAPEVYRQTFGVGDGFPELSVLDSTDPLAVAAFAGRLEPAEVLFLVSTKSGKTVETLSFYRFFYEWARHSLGDKARRHFIAITDPLTPLEKLAWEHEFRLFCNDPHIGGRYSALSYFGLVPAALIGLDLDELLGRAAAMADRCRMEVDNPAVELGIALGTLAAAGRDKLTFLPGAGSLGNWIEQLIAESTGKEGKGILPVIGEQVGPSQVYGPDRAFVYLHRDGDDSGVEAMNALRTAGHPVIEIRMRDEYDLGGQFFLWEMATAIAGYVLGVNPFDQPNVEATKKQTRRMLREWEATGKLPTATMSHLDAGTLTAFLDSAQAGDYIALQVYAAPTPATDVALSALRTRLRDRYRLATTVGYGPRFLHSTGQLHKGGPNSGLFVQFITDYEHPLSIPGEGLKFSVLKKAQALGDRQALLDAGRRVLTFRLGQEIATEIERLTAAL